MKTATTLLINALKDRAGVMMAELYTFTLIDGSVYRYTSIDVNIPWQENIFMANEMVIRRGSLRQAIGLDVDDLDITIAPTTANIGGIGWLAALRNGALDNASVKLERIFYKYWSESGCLGGITAFMGNVSDIDPIGRSAAKLRIKSTVELLSVQWPHLTYESQCHWHLYGPGCGVNKTSFSVTGNTLAGGNLTVFPISLNQANGYFDLGVIRFTSGNNVDLVRTIKSYSSGNISVAYPLTNPPEGNESFDIYPGCDKTVDTCNLRFTNSNNYRGFPFIPSPETAL